MMAECMHVLAEQFIRVFIPQQAEAGWVAERTPALEIDPEDSFGRRFQQQTEPVLAFPQLLVRPLAFGDIEERDNRPDYSLPFPLWIGPVFDWKARPVGLPKLLIIKVNALSLVKCLEHQAVLHGKWGPVPVGMMDEFMHVFAEQFIRVFIPQLAEAGWVAERTTALEIDPENSFGRRVQQQTEFVLAFPQLLFRLLAFGDVGNYAVGIPYAVSFISADGAIMGPNPPPILAPSTAFHVIGLAFGKQRFEGFTYFGGIVGVDGFEPETSPCRQKSSAL